LEFFIFNIGFLLLAMMDICAVQGEKRSASLLAAEHFRHSGAQIDALRVDGSLWKTA